MAVAFVAGATGFVGRAVVDALRPHAAVVAHVRPDSRKLDAYRARFAGAGVEVDTSAWEPAAIAAALARVAPTHVFGLLGTTRAQAKAEGLGGDIYERVDYGLTKLLCEAAAATGRPRFVLLSSVGVGPRAGSAYLRAHWKAEEVVRASGLPYVIARPSFIVPGRGGARRDDRRPTEKAGATVIDGALAVAGLVAPRVRARFRSTTPEILAAALVRHALADGPSVVLEGADLR